MQIRHVSVGRGGPTGERAGHVVRRRPVSAGQGRVEDQVHFAGHAVGVGEIESEDGPEIGHLTGAVTAGEEALLQSPERLTVSDVDANGASSTSTSSPSKMPQ